ncbi:MAG: hypothetical protein H8E84_08710 [Flavobacteriales bacterium]|nr:hypothetical protein [Flavobacteriales bacterium]
MILIADSGSTKCTWALPSKTKQEVQYFTTIGFNPYFIDKEKIISHLEQSELNNYANDITEIHFYGAGCSNEKMRKLIADSLISFFKNATISVKHDLDAACIATYNGGENICCILGTGSNSCFYDGKNILEAAPSLGFIVGDEASGNYFGKKILNLYFNNKLPEKLKEKFRKQYKINIKDFSENVYQKEKPNKYLATFFRFLTQNKEEVLFQKIIKDGVREFFDLHVCCYENYQNHQIHFAGSVAHFLEDELKEVAKELNCKIGQIIQNPINNLVKHHQKIVVRNH